MKPEANMTQKLGLPLLFVAIWSTGFIGAKYSAPHASPLALLSLRFALAGLIMMVIAASLRAPWPKGPQALGQIVAGILLHGTYLGPVFWVIAHGMPAGIVALITGLQPFLTAILAAYFLGEGFRKGQALGLILGLVGVGLVVAPQITSGFYGVTPFNLVLMILAIFSIAAGTVWQKAKANGVDLRTGTSLQYAGAALICAFGMGLFEQPFMEWQSPVLWLALGWLIFGLSIGAISLFMILLRRGSAGGVASFIYLVPAVTALMAYVAFGESLMPMQILGMIICAAGVLILQKA